jgi:hypothetical protein
MRLLLYVSENEVERKKRKKHMVGAVDVFRMGFMTNQGGIPKMDSGLKHHHYALSWLESYDIETCHSGEIQC